MRSLDISSNLDFKVEKMKELFSLFVEKEVKTGQKFLNDLNDLISVAEIETHSRNVAKYALMIYENLPAYEKQKNEYKSEHIYHAGYYHDIGKAMIIKCFPEMLNKKAFDNTDRTIIKEHTHFGAVLLYWFASIEKYDINEPLFNLLLNGCLYHHERRDGSGYLGLTEPHIPFIGNLIAVADCYSAGIEHRVYSEAKARENVLDELSKMPLDQMCVSALKTGLS